jgi:aminopeptidase N
MEDRNPDKYQLYAVITHEIGHNWFPMIVGSNERMQFWQDEGLNTFINTFAEGLRYPDQGDQSQRSANTRHEIEQTQVYNADIPITTPADRIPPQKLGFTAYYKTAAGLDLLREEILGRETFDDAFRTYIKRWAFKHPSPADFYRTMENVSGRRLDWFWRGWFLESPHFDQSIDSVLVSGSQVTVQYGNRARGVLPIRARFTFADGTTQDFIYPAEVWSTNTGAYARVYEFAKEVTRIDLDPDRRLIDVDRKNNVWTKAAQ